MANRRESLGLAVLTATQFTKAAEEIGATAICHGIIAMHGKRRGADRPLAMLFHQLQGPVSHTGQTLALPVASVIGYPPIQSPTDDERIHLLTGASNRAELTQLISQHNATHPDSPLPSPLSPAGRYRLAR